MDKYFNQAQYINDKLRVQLTEWLSQWVYIKSPEALDEQGQMSLYTIRAGMQLLVEQGIFSSVKEIKLHFGKAYKTILPDFIFEKNLI